MPTPIPPPPAVPHVPTGRELYDALMEHIEPELVTDAVKTLNEKYRGETPENHAARMQRYDLAFERYDTAYREYLETLDAQVRRYRQESFAHVELQDRATDESMLDRFSTLFQQAV